MGHLKKDCENLFVCYVCGEEGHIARNCGIETRRCLECNEIGHLKNDCPNTIYV